MSEQRVPLEEIMGDRFGRYSKYIIQDRALPDVRDGLKPVQRRILYAMYKEGNTFSKPYRKCAKTVGVVIGNYHPHGDSSVYEAMIRLSQEWKMRIPLVDVQGNNGSIDNDPPAAMRYTEARLAKISELLLEDLDKDTCPMALNFDDTEYEPTVLPARFPNLLVNGATGISAGYATDIPPHNLEEIIAATIYRVTHPLCDQQDILNLVKGPDFPTGGIVEGKEGITQALKTGRGRVLVKAKAEIKPGKQINQIIISEIPYEVNKAELVHKMDEIRFNHAIDGILEVRDESDRAGLSIVVDLKKEADAGNILNYLYKNTDLSRYYTYNMVAIRDKRPEQLGLVQLIDAYIAHQIEVVTNRTLFDLKKTRARLHIVEGLIKMISILDEVIAVIRQSKDKADAKRHLIAKFDFTEPQAEAIVMLQLYRLTNTDVVALEAESAQLQTEMRRLNDILDSDDVLRSVICRELEQVQKDYPCPRRTLIKDEISDISVDMQAMIIAEDVYVTMTRDGYLKRVSTRSYHASEKASFGKKNEDVLFKAGLVNTTDVLLVFTDRGNFCCLPVNRIEEFKWRDTGRHISYLCKTDSAEKVVAALAVREFKPDLEVVMATAKGQIKRTRLADFKMTRYTRPAKAMAVKADDELIAADFCDPGKAVMLVSDQGMVNFYSASAVSLQSLKAAGMKGISLKGEERLVAMQVVAPLTKAHLFLVSQDGMMKAVKVTDIPVTNRAVRGIPLFKNTKSKPQTLTGAVVLNKEESAGVWLLDGSTQVLEFNQLTPGSLSARLKPVCGPARMVYDERLGYEKDYVVSEVQDGPDPDYEKLSFDL